MYGIDFWMFVHEGQPSRRGWEASKRRYDVMGVKIVHTGGDLGGSASELTYDLGGAIRGSCFWRLIRVFSFWDGKEAKRCFCF